jgi:hypothetical protein
MTKAVGLCYSREFSGDLVALGTVFRLDVSEVCDGYIDRRACAAGLGEAHQGAQVRPVGVYGRARTLVGSR